MNRKIEFTGKQEIRILLTPEGKPFGRKPLSASVYTTYAQTPEARFVQELCGLIGGDVVYLSSESEGKVLQTVPVSGWRDPTAATLMSLPAQFVNAAWAARLDVTAFGASREKWKLSAYCMDQAEDELDNRTDRTYMDGRPSGRVEANGIRSDF